VKLIPVDTGNEAHLRDLYDLLEERTPGQSISHRRMPTWQEHKDHVYAMTNPASERAHQDWCLIQNAAGIVGAVYLREFQGHGYGPNAVVMMMMKHGERNYLANVAPNNEASRKMFEKLGFKLIQVTLALEAK
jgi:RimJ/RimL family protein N-acetyltransferase